MLEWITNCAVYDQLIYSRSTRHVAARSEEAIDAPACAGADGTDRVDRATRRGEYVRMDNELRRHNSKNLLFAGRVVEHIIVLAGLALNT